MVYPVEILEQKAQEYYEFLRYDYEVNDIGVCINRAKGIGEVMVDTGKMLADAKWHLDDIMRGEFVKIIKEGVCDQLPPSAVNRYIQSACKKYNYLVNWIEQIDKESKYQFDMMRTFISRLKNEQDYYQYGNK